MTQVPRTQALSRPHALRGRANTLLGLAYLAIFGVFIGLRLTLIQPSSSDRWSDPDDYLRVAQLPITSMRFWAGERVFGFPLLMKLLGYNQVAIIAAQFALATLCWALCAFAFAACMRVRGLRPIVFGLVLGFSLSLDIVQWDFLIFSESIASSLMALMIGLWLLILRSYAAETPRWQRAALFGMVALTTILWSFVRDTNPYIVLGLAGMIGLCLLCRWRRVHDRAVYLGLLALFVAIFLVQNWTADSGRRWQYPLMNVIGKRILVDQRRTAFFAANGMPTDAKVMRFRDNFAHAHGNAVFHDADMAYFRDWLDARGKATYMRFLLSNLGEALREPLREYRTILRPPLGYYGERAGLAFPSWLLVLTGLLYIRAPEPVAAITLVMLLALIVAALRSGRAVWLVPVLMALLVYPSMFLAWHGDGIEVGRHSYLVGVLLRLAFWMLGCFIADMALSWVADRRRGAVRLGLA